MSGKVVSTLEGHKDSVFQLTNGLDGAVVSCGEDHTAVSPFCADVDVLMAACLERYVGYPRLKTHGRSRRGRSRVETSLSDRLGRERVAKRGCRHCWFGRARKSMDVG